MKRNWLALLLAGGCGQTASQMPEGVAPEGDVAPQLMAFAVSPASVASGVPTELTWTWSYAEVPAPPPTCSIDQGVGATESGSASTVTLALDTGFTLRCVNRAGSASA